MFRKFFIFLLCLYALTFNAVSAEESWYPFTLQAKMDEQSPMNMGKRVLDAPAGRHGFLQAKEDNFTFENGTPAKFWGTNLCFSANFPDKKQAGIMAERLAFFGFNAVRLHHMDYFFESQGIWKDTAPALDDPQLKPTGNLSPRQLDRLDYLIHQLKKQGIYININLLVARFFTEADGIVDAEKLGMAAKPVSLFDAKLIALQKQYAKDLLTHLNPYTELRYADDPAIALIEITNENSLINSWKKNTLNSPDLPPTYVTQLDDRWNIWLKKKYHTADNLRQTWKINTSGQPAPPLSSQELDLKLEQLNGAKAVKTQEDSASTVRVANITDTAWHLQLAAKGLNLIYEKRYRISFSAQSDVPAKITLIAQQSYSPWRNLGLSRRLELTSEPKEFSFIYIPTERCPNTKIGFVIGSQKALLTIDNVLLEEISPTVSRPDMVNIAGFRYPRPLYSARSSYNKIILADITSFYNELTQDYFTEMKNFLTQECGVKIPVTGIGGYNEPGDFKNMAMLDYIDDHIYWDHPKFPDKPWQRNNFTIRNHSIITDKGLGIIRGIKNQSPKNRAPSLGRLKHDVSDVKNNLRKPYTISEWNHCYPNIFAYETPTLVAAYAHQEKWDGLFHFAYSHGWDIRPAYNVINSHFDSLANTQQMILLSIGSLIYHSENQLTITHQDDHYIITSPAISIISGRIAGKNFLMGPLKVTAREDGTVILFSSTGQDLQKASSFTLITVSAITNKGKDPYQPLPWGIAPVLLKHLPVDIQMATNGNIKVFPLDIQGRNEKEITTRLKDGKTHFSTSAVNAPWFWMEMGIDK